MDVRFLSQGPKRPCGLLLRAALPAYETLNLGVKHRPNIAFRSFNGLKMAAQFNARTVCVAGTNELEYRTFETSDVPANTKNNYKSKLNARRFF